MTRSLPIALCLTSIVGLAAPGLAGWPPTGLVISTAPDVQIRARIHQDGAGGVFLAWSDRRNAGDGSSQRDVFATRVTYHGESATGWALGGSTVATGPGDQQAASIADDGQGGVFIAVTQAAAPNADLHVFRLDADGQPSPGWPVGGALVRAATVAGSVSMFSDGDGGVWVAWDDRRAGTDLYGVRLTTAGVPADGFPAGGVLIASPGFNPSVRADGSGGLLAAWGDSRNLGAGTSSKVWASRLSHDGTLAAGWIAGGNPVMTSGRGAELPSIVPDGTGGAYVAWHDYRTWPASEPPVEFYLNVYAQHLTSTGAVDPAWPLGGVGLATSFGADWDVRTTSDGAGGAYVSWSAQSQPRLARLNSLGRDPAWPAEGRIVSQTQEALWGGMDLIDDGLGGAHVLSYASVNGLQRVQQNSSIAPGWPANGLTLNSGPYGQRRGEIAPDEQGGVYVAWTDETNRLLLQHLTMDGAVAVQLTLVKIDATSERIRIEWRTTSSAQSFVVERRDGLSEWTPMTTMTPEGDGGLRYEDRDVMPATRYEYRLSWTEADGAHASEPVAAEVPRRFAAVGFRPNPMTAAPRIEFSLTSEGPVSIDLVDAAGRVVARREWEGQRGLGSWTFAGLRLSPGLYFVRLSQAGQTHVARGMVLR